MMHGYGFDGWDWFWMAPMTLLWIVALGIVIYGAVRIAVHHERGGHRS